MNRRFCLLLLWAALGGLPAFAVGDEKKDEKVPADLPDTAESARLVEKMPKAASGTVFLDKKGLADVRVTDGVEFVTTDQQGKYAITIQPDPTVPYLPSRTISVCWPTGTWPVQEGKRGRWQWWARLKDVKDPEKVDFHLASKQQELPVCVAFGTDPHDALRREQNNIFRDEVARAGSHVDFGVMGGDLGYLGFGNAAADYTSIEEFTNEFPVPMLHCIGNHDIVGIHSKWWSIPHELAGNGAFIKYLGPIRWSFDCAGIHFVGLDWSRIDEKGHLQCGMSAATLDWLEKDLESVPKDRPTYLFSHQWGDERFSKLCSQYGVKLCLAGHSHRNMYMGNHGGTEYWTKMSLYTLLYADRAGFEFVDRCIYRGGRNGWDGYWRHSHRGCALYNDAEMQAQQRGNHVGLEQITLDSRTRVIEPVKGPTYDLRIGARGIPDKPARRWGVRITAASGKVCELAYDELNNELILMGRKTYFDPEILHPAAVSRAADATDRNEQHWVEMRVFVMPHRVRVRINSRLHYQKFIEFGPAKRIELFAEDGQVEFGRVDLWQRTWPKNWDPCATANSG